MPRNVHPPCGTRVRSRWDTLRQQRHERRAIHHFEGVKNTNLRMHTAIRLLTPTVLYNSKYRAKKRCDPGFFSASVEEALIPKLLVWPSNMLVPISTQFAKSSNKCVSYVGALRSSRKGRPGMRLCEAPFKHSWMGKLALRSKSVSTRSDDLDQALLRATASLAHSGCESLAVQQAE